MLAMTVFSWLQTEGHDTGVEGLTEQTDAQTLLEWEEGSRG